MAMKDRKFVKMWFFVDTYYAPLARKRRKVQIEKETRISRSANIVKNLDTQNNNADSSRIIIIQMAPKQFAIIARK